MKKILVAVLLILLCIPFLGCDDAEAPDMGAPEESSSESSEVKKPEKERKPDDIDPKALTYHQALLYLNEGKIEEAYDLFLSIKDYQDTNVYLDRFSFQYDREISKSDDYETCISYEYNTYGKKTLIEYNGMCSCTYEYDDNQNLIRESYCCYGYDEAVTRYEYDARGNILRCVEGGRVTEYICDYEGRLLAYIYKNQGEITYCDVYEYDSHGRCVKITGTNSRISETVTEKSYDDRGNLIEERVKQSNGRVDLHQYEYDTKGNKIKEVFFDSTFAGYVTITWKYDENGNMTERKKEYENGYGFTDYFEYDSAGRCVRETTVYVRWNSPSVTTYEYDSYGNLIKKTYADVVVTYSGYQLYYNPYGEQELPHYIDGK